MRVLGIDPGYDRLGLAVVEKNTAGKEVVLFSGCVTTDRKLSFPERLRQIGLATEKVIVDYRPTLLCLEKIFFGKNHKTATAVAGVRGLILYLGAGYKVTITEYTPMEIKMTITGFGQADKKQLADMIGRLVKLPKRPRLDDEFDAIGVALTGLSREKILGSL